MKQQSTHHPLEKPNQLNRLSDKIRSKSLYVAGDTFDVASDLYLYGKELQACNSELLEEIRDFFIEAKNMMGSLIDWLDQLEKEANNQPKD